MLLKDRTTAGRRSIQNIALTGPALVAKLAAVDRQRFDETVINLSRTIPITRKDLYLATRHDAVALRCHGHALRLVAQTEVQLGCKAVFIFDTAPSTTGILVAAREKGTYPPEPVSSTMTS